MSNEKRWVRSVEIKNKIQEDIAREVKGLSVEQEIEYFRQESKDESLRTWWNEAKKRQPGHLKKAS